MTETVDRRRSKSNRVSNRDHNQTEHHENQTGKFGYLVFRNKADAKGLKNVRMHLRNENGEISRKPVTIEP
jgi:hypothetical protein